MDFKKIKGRLSTSLLSPNRKESILTNPYIRVFFTTAVAEVLAVAAGWPALEPLMLPAGECLVL